MIKKAIFWMLIVLILVFLVGTISSAVYHHFMLEREEMVLDEYGVGERVNADGKEINVFSYGNREADTALVFMAGLGIGDAVIAARPMLSKLEGKFRIFVIDRPGTGMSPDTEEERTLEAIVQEYRSALAVSGQKAPYLLMAHSIAGIYAQYWASKYPQEVSGIVYLDCTPAEVYAQQGPMDSLSLFGARLENLFCSAGLQRFFVPKADLIGDEEKNLLAQQERERCLLLTYHNTGSEAVLSEKELCYQNALTVLENLNVEQVPQLYLAADCLTGPYYEEIFRSKIQGRFGDDVEGSNACMQEIREEISNRVNYAVVHGKVTVKYISGPHVLYRYAPNEIAEEVKAWCG